MKKFFMFALCAFSAAGLFGASLQSFKGMNDGDEILSKHSGRLSSVDVFSTQEDGTVGISRVFSAPFYTNRYDTTTTVTTNIVNNPTTDYKFVMNGTVDFMPSMTSSVQDVWSANITNVRHVVGFWKDSQDQKWFFGPTNYIGTSSMLNIAGTGDQNVVDFTEVAGFDARFVKTQYSIDHWSTNIVTTVTTNAIVPVLAYELVVTNSIFDAACSNNCFHGSPSPDVWIFPNDKLLFKGTATGGVLRIVIE